MSASESVYTVTSSGTSVYETEDSVEEMAIMLAVEEDGSSGVSYRNSSQHVDSQGIAENGTLEVQEGIMNGGQLRTTSANVPDVNYDMLTDMNFMENGDDHGMESRTETAVLEDSWTTYFSATTASEHGLTVLNSMTHRERQDRSIPADNSCDSDNSDHFRIRNGVQELQISDLDLMSALAAEGTREGIEVANVDGSGAAHIVLSSVPPPTHRSGVSYSNSRSGDEIGHVISLSSREDDPMEVDTERKPGHGVDNVIELSDDDDDVRQTYGNRDHDGQRCIEKCISHADEELQKEPGEGSGAGKMAILDRMEETIRSRPNMLYTPLQRWEYENNLPVDGVEDTEAWAREVGLADLLMDHSLPGKRQKIGGSHETPKYIVSEPVSFEELNLVHNAPSTDAKVGENSDKDKEADSKRKGKEKVDD